MGSVVEFAIPVRVVSEANRRDHFMAKAKRVSGQREAVRLTWLSLSSHQRESCGRWLYLRGGLCITMTVLSSHAMDGDNLIGALKAIRDELAACAGMDNDTEIGPVEWRYADREKGKGLVRVRIEPRDVAESAAPGTWVRIPKEAA